MKRMFAGGGLLRRFANAGRLLAGAALDSDDFWYEPVPSMGTISGAAVTATTAMRLSAVQACVRLIAGTVSKVPLPIYRRIGDNDREKATSHPLYGLLNEQPNPQMDAMEFRRMMTANLALSGQTMAQIEPGPRGAIDTLWPFKTGQCMPRSLTDGSVVYDATLRDGRQKTLDPDQVFHIRDLTLDGVNGLSRIAQAREGIGIGLAAEQSAAAAYNNGVITGLMLTTDKELNPKQFENLQEKIKERHGGYLNAWKPMIAHSGLKPVGSGVNLRDMQFMEARQFSVEDVARLYGVPPHLIGLTDKQTSWGTGVEQMTIGFLAFTLLDWYEMWESAIARQLILRSDTYYAEHLVDGLLRADFKTRMEGYRIGIESGMVSPDECRARENMNPRADGLGGRYLKPINIGFADEPTPAPTQVPKNGGGAVHAAAMTEVAA